MKVGIDARVLGTSRALDRYTRNLVENLLKVEPRHDYVLFSDRDLAGHGFGLPVVQVPPKLTFRDHFAMARSIKESGVDIFFHPDNIEFWRMPVPSVVTIHDLTPYKFPDLVFSKSPILRMRQQFYFYLQKKAILKNTDLVITVSENTKEDVCQVFRLPPERVKVIYEGVEEKFQAPKNREFIEEVKEKYHIGTDSPYIFYIGGMGRHKNVSILVEAFAQVVRRGAPDNLRLVIGGKTAGDVSSGQNDYSNLVKQIATLEMADRVIFTGFVADEDLPVLYSGAAVFVYPSLYEGFGFPPLEAMACGCPVVVSKSSSLPEVVGEAGALVDPRAVGEFTEKILEVLSLSPAKRQQVVERGLKQAQQFSWEKCARETAAAL
ncbi:glycosyltransferase family 4 protein, partial [Candidatus Parcubacteria bacterium]|nr:glycosyltransferase family 4 protein [Candidatus Parcubacteria bacterium]